MDLCECEASLVKFQVRATQWVYSIQGGLPSICKVLESRYSGKAEERKTNVYRDWNWAFGEAVTRKAPIPAQLPSSPALVLLWGRDPDPRGGRAGFGLACALIRDQEGR